MPHSPKPPAMIVMSSFSSPARAAVASGKIFETAMLPLSVDRACLAPRQLLPGPCGCQAVGAPFRGLCRRGRSPRAARSVTTSDLPFEAHGDAHAAADAESGEAFFGVALVHLKEQGGEDTRA